MQVLLSSEITQCYDEFIYWSSVEGRGLNVEGEGKKSRARVKG